MADVRFDRASRVHPATKRSAPVRAVDALDLTVRDGEFLAVVGPSGSGKTTALRMLAGLDPVDEGRVEIAGRDVTRMHARDRDIAMVFQSYALYPHMSVAQNMSFALRLSGVPRERIRERVARTAAMLGLEELLDRRPSRLSGGQRQRVAMGRAVVREPTVFLMDEPLSNLDAKLRGETRARMVELQRDLGTTTVYVTHDQVEATTMGHRVAVLDHGVLQQVDTPTALYERPANAMVAAFVGNPTMPLHDLPTTEGGVRLGDLTIPIPRDARTALGPRVTVGLRPEALAPVGADEPGIDLVVRIVEHAGADQLVHGHCADRPDLTLLARLPVRETVTVGGVLRVAPTGPEAAHLFDPVSGQRLPGT